MQLKFKILFINYGIKMDIFQRVCYNSNQIAENLTLQEALYMTKETFLQLADQILLLDGATGSNLMAAGMPRGVCTEEWVLSHKDVIPETAERIYRSRKPNHLRSYLWRQPVQSEPAQSSGSGKPDQPYTGQLFQRNRQWQGLCSR